MPHKDPKVQLMAKLGLQDCTPQEQSPGVGLQVLSQNGAQSGSWHSPHQLVVGKLAGTNKAKAACQRESPMPGMSLARLLFVKGQPFCWNLLKMYYNFQEMRLQGTTRGNKNLLYGRLLMLLEAYPQQTLLKNKSKGTILPLTCNVFGQEIPANYIVK
jgi:hypothetical protein